MMSDEDIKEYHNIGVNRVFCIGNAESRVGFDLEKLRPHGMIYGCNAIYRDFMPDVLTAVDNGIIHEIYHSGIASKIPCYFRNWTKLPKMTYDGVVRGMISEEEFKELSEYDIIKENKDKKEQAEEFVIHGTNMKGMVSILRNAQKTHSGKPKDIIQKQINSSHIYVSWITPDDKSNDIRDVWKEYKDHGWACGASAGFVAVKREQPKEIYMIGHDLVSNTRLVNNIYAGTKHYVAKENTATPHDNWVNQWYTLMDWNPNIKFYKVNKALDDRPTNSPIDVWDPWHKRGQLEYITYEQMMNKLNGGLTRMTISDIM
ncbi:MAG: hypothetical protein CMK29_01855 [Porticoccaceae bacterium]|nr:hypothetical protein [Porticoccaceae bacterium]OUW59149.1 MAG: hypothetical protein CBD57_01165 [Candidatus Pelagibacter sp. TMED197]